MKSADITQVINEHTRWRRQFFNAFAGGNYADMPLSEHRGCVLVLKLAALGGAIDGFAGYARLLSVHDRFHAIASEIVDLSENGMAASADLLLPQLSEASYHVVELLGELREYLGGSVVL